MLNVKQSDMLFRKVTTKRTRWRGLNQGQGDLHQRCMPRAFQRLCTRSCCGPSSASLLPVLEHPYPFTCPLSHFLPCCSQLASRWPTLDSSSCSRGLVPSVASHVFILSILSLSMLKHPASLLLFEPHFPVTRLRTSVSVQFLFVSLGLPS